MTLDPQIDERPTMRGVVPDADWNLTVAELPRPEPGPNEVLLRMRVSGINPTDWKSRVGITKRRTFRSVVHQDGAGDIEAVGPGVDPALVGRRAWVWLGAYVGGGTAAEYAVLPTENVVPMADDASYDLGASLGVPAMTAHQALTSALDGPRVLARDALVGRTILVAGGAGAVGHAAIELARWAGARVLTTVSGPAKAELATAAGAHAWIDYTTADAADQVHALAPDGVDLVVEVDPTQNATIIEAVCAQEATIAFYAGMSVDGFGASVRSSMEKNLHWRGILLYTMSSKAKDAAVRGISAALSDGVLRTGAAAGLPLHRYPLEQTAQAQLAVENGAIGKVLVDCWSR